VPFSKLIAIDVCAAPLAFAADAPDTPAALGTTAVPDDTPAPGTVSGVGAYGVLLAINVKPVLIFDMTSGGIIVPFCTYDHE
jgi:hypothetical protein